MGSAAAAGRRFGKEKTAYCDRRKLYRRDDLCGDHLGQRSVRRIRLRRLLLCELIKQKVVGVKEETLATYGAVSEKTAMEMARGVRILSGADIGVSTTGIAGPLGGTPYKPVGLVYIGVSTEMGLKAEKMLLAEGGADRRRIRELAVAAAMYFALKETEKTS